MQANETAALLRPNSPSVPVKYVSDIQLSQRHAVSRGTIWRWTKEGRFPKPVKLGPGCTRWLLADVEKWEQEREAC